MSIAVIVGTRPEGIKLAPLVDLLAGQAKVIHTGQHYSVGMNGHVRADRELGHRPAEGSSRGRQLGEVISQISAAFAEERPDAVVVQGDTTSALAGALAANAAGIPLLHVEAGLRSFDRAMPEEHNRVLIDHLADLCCAPTSTARRNLLAERIPCERIAVTGNTIVEAAQRALPGEREQAAILDQLGVAHQPYVLATIHRPENTDSPALLGRILDQLAMLPTPVVLPLHPRTRQQIWRVELADLADKLRLTEPLDYPTLLTLLSHAAIIVTDSGGIQEEATVFHKPVVVVRRSNERPEVEVSHGVRVEPSAVISEVITTWLFELENVHGRLARLPSPYGDGTASAQITRLLRQLTPGRFGLATEASAA